MKDLESIRKKLIDMGLSVRHVFAATFVFTSIHKKKSVAFAQLNFEKFKNNFPVKHWLDVDTPITVWPKPESRDILSELMLGDFVAILKTNTDTFRVIFYNNINDISTVVKIWASKDGTVIFGSVKIWSDIEAWEVVSRWNEKTRLLSYVSNRSLVDKAKAFGLKQINKATFRPEIPYFLSDGEYRYFSDSENAPQNRKKS